MSKAAFRTWARARRRPRRRRMLGPREALSFLSFVSIFLVIPVPARAQKLANPDVVPTGILALHIRGLTSVSTAGAFTANLRKQEGGQESYVQLADVMEDAVSESNCFLKDEKWVEAVADFYKLRGWEPANGACSSSTTQRVRKSEFSPLDTFERLGKTQVLIDKVKNAVMKETVGNFTNIFFPGEGPMRRGSRIQQRCYSRRQTGLRVVREAEVEWYVLTGITNAEVDRDMEAWERQFVTEFVGVSLRSRKFIDPMLQVLKPAGIAGESSEREKAPTSFEMWSGRIGTSGIFSMPTEESPAVLLAVDKMDLDVDQARDAVTISNIAILALPMIINIIPVALLADVNAIGLLVYTLLTDVVTTVPFIIKGFELIGMGSRKYQDQAAWFRGKKEEDALLVELWAAECRILNVGRLGVAFVIIGFVFMLLGILSEIFARQLRDKWKRSSSEEKSRASAFRSVFVGSHKKSEKCSDGTINFCSDDEDAAFVAQQEAARRLDPLREL